MKGRNNYSLEFKKQAVELSNARGSTAEIARELGICSSNIRRWKKELDTTLTTKTDAKENRIRSLEKELKAIKLERDILKKAVCIFSKNDRTNINL